MGVGGVGGVGASRTRRRAPDGRIHLVDGACLTVVAIHSDGFEVDASAETLARTTLGGLAQGATA